MTKNPLVGRQVVLGVTGSIAAFKAVGLASEMTKRGAKVDVVMTMAATKFVAPLSFQAITHRPVVSDLFRPDAELAISHVGLGQRAELMIVAPASADAIARIALGLADDPLTATSLATRAPLIVAPAMETAMFESPATQANLRRLVERGVTIVGPATGRLASGEEGPGRMVEPAEIIESAEAILGRRQDLAGRHIVVSAGGTREPVDPVRYLGNRSSGRMGHAIAEAAQGRGARVTLVTAAIQTAPAVAKIVSVETTLEMKTAVEAAASNADALIMAAAVADYRPLRPADRKIKKQGKGLRIDLEENPDIVAGLQSDGLVKFGFAAETENLIDNARAKMDAKGLEAIVANDVTSPGSGFGSDTNRVTIIRRSGRMQEYPLMSKHQVAEVVLDHLVETLPARG
jgi:phosphopantothenoylcysteine decarboxylase/phosphopantothenate--cysteine ligase